MKRLSRAIFLILLLISCAAIARPQVVLITIGPGDASWEKFGHDMLWIDDADRNIDLCYNWGVFDFDQPNFILNFVLGRMTYWMDAYEPHAAMGIYWEQKRLVTMQRLVMTDGEIDRMIDLCEANRLPQNSSYQYDYFKDNCSTRVRDMIDQSTGGRFTRQCLAGAKASGLSYRGHAMRLMQDDFWLSLGIDFSLGPRCDLPLTPAQECFLPTPLAKYVAGMTESQWTPWTTDRSSEPTTLPNRAPWLAAAGVGLGALVIALTRWRRQLGLTLVVLWWLISGLGGCFLLFVWCFTDHIAAHSNQNVLHFSPLAWIALACLIIKRPQAAAAIAWAIVGISAIALLLDVVGALRQHNIGFIALALPLNLAAALVVRLGRLTPAPQPSEVIAT